MSPRWPSPRPLLTALACLALLAAAPSPAPSPRLSASPSLHLSIPASPPPELAEAEALRLAGDFQAAAERFRALAEAGDPALRPRAWLGLGETLQAAGDAQSAAEALGQVISAGQADQVRGRALVRLAALRRDHGDCRAALALLHEADPLLPLGPYLALQRAACHARLGEHGLAAAEAQLALQQAATPPARVDALEQLALASQELGWLEDAVRWYTELASAARTEAFRAQTRLRLGELERALGHPEQAVHHFRALVVEQPGQPAAAAALSALREMGRQDVVSYAQAGQVALAQGRLDEAEAAFAAYLRLEPDGAEAAQARYSAALARLRRGDDLGAAQALAAMAERHPDSPLAPAALLRAGRVLESLGLLAQAAEAYERLATAHPDAPQAGEARFRLGFTLWLRGERFGARAAWSDLAADPRAPAGQRALAELWLGLAADGRSSTAVGHWQSALRLDPLGYAGLRAAARLAEAGVSARPAEDPPSVSLSPAAWFAQRGQDWEAALAEVQADPRFQLASLLWAAGLEAEGGRELSALADSLATHPERLLALSAHLARPPTQHLSLSFAARAARALGVPLAELPADLQRLLYPLPYEPLLRTSGERFGVDPLLMAALARQESTFNPAARSPAGALGLTQVMPQTGQLIARALGAGGFQSAHLLRPVVSLEFGAWYLGGRLARYQGQLLPALAAYNAGDSPVNAWLAQYCADPDCFAERIPYQETYRYVRIVLENYGHYLRLYGDR